MLNNTIKSNLNIKYLPNIIGISRKELTIILIKIGIKKKYINMRISQIWRWLYVFGITDWYKMHNINKSLLNSLSKKYSITRPKLIKEQISIDGTRKWLIETSKEYDNSNIYKIECVYIPEKNRGTLCLSSQVGCTLNCPFCYTGTSKMLHNLSAQEIISQVMIAKDLIGDWPNKYNLYKIPKKINNIVYMGMGEPLYNYEHVKQSINIIKDTNGISLSNNRITLSTSGVVNFINKIGEETGCRLAISLHAVTDELRDTLVPINKKFNLKKLINTCRTYPGVSNSRRITFEYIMLKNINDSITDAKKLILLLKNIPSKINLIPFNPWINSKYKCSDLEQIKKFAKIINDANYISLIRKPRGQDIMAACGQLKY